MRVFHLEDDCLPDLLRCTFGTIEYIQHIINLLVMLDCLLLDNLRCVIFAGLTFRRMGRPFSTRLSCVTDSVHVTLFDSAIPGCVFRKSICIIRCFGDKTFIHHLHDHCREVCEPSHQRSRCTTALRVLGRGCNCDFVYNECPTLPSAQPPPVPGSSYTRVWIQMLLLMPQKFNIPTLKIRCLLETWVMFSIVQ